MPQYKHDCEWCKFICTEKVMYCDVEPQTVDWYIHIRKEPLNTEMIGRYNDDGPDYWSYPEFLLDPVKYPELCALQHVKRAIELLSQFKEE